MLGLLFWAFGVMLSVDRVWGLRREAFCVLWDGGSPIV